MKYVLPIIVLIAGMNLISCAGNQELLAEKQSEVDSLIILSNDLIDNHICSAFNIW